MTLKASIHAGFRGFSGTTKIVIGQPNETKKASAQEIAALIKRNYPGSQSDIDASALLVG
jgi:hypothetical protein